MGAAYFHIRAARTLQRRGDSNAVIVPASSGLLCCRLIDPVGQLACPLARARRCLVQRGPVALGPGRLVGHADVRSAAALAFATRGSGRVVDLVAKTRSEAPIRGGVSKPL